MESLGRQSYSRKEKSLGVLVSNFLRLYNRDDVDLIGLDDAAGKLGVERRRIYDVVNILESIGLVARRGKNQYSWKGFGQVPLVLSLLKEEGMREKFGIIPCVTNSEMVLYDQVREEPLKLSPDDLENSPSPKLDSKKEKSLWVLAQNFVKLFLCSDDDMITLDGATKALLNVSQDPMNMRTKVRRLYDIANVFSSMNLIEKTHIPETKKPAYRWLGVKAISEARFLAAPAADLCDRIEPKKRVFGTEITNFTPKRAKIDGSKGPQYYESENTCSVSKQEQPDSKSAVKSLVGPSSPGDTSKNTNSGKSNNQSIDVLETLSSTHKLQYSNHELTGLLGHYTETWRSWHEEFRRK
ncbi:E2F transcription factor-like E2FD [Hirschfeldia incana]|nr:E2F transcription factor-like E2FD [Hirschfeldia incana]